MNINKIDGAYIRSRTATLKDAAVERNERISKYIRMYTLDVYEGRMPPNEYRVSLPLAFDLVEKLRALLVTRPPIYTVPAGTANMPTQERAQKIERWLDGAASMMNLDTLLPEAAWWAICAGIGIMKLAYDPNAAEDEFPLVLHTPDPRACYWSMDARKDRFTEFVHSWERPRREIEDEWGVSLPPPAKLNDAVAMADWGDIPITYIEYWVEVTDWEDVAPPKEPAPLLTDMVQQAYEAQQGAASGLAPDEIQAALKGGEDYSPGETENAPGDAGEDAKEGENEAPVVTRRRVRKVVHCVAVDEGVFRKGRKVEDLGLTIIKKPVVMPYYKRIPFFLFPGTQTPMGGANANLSALYPLTNGSSDKTKSVGVLAAMNMGLSMGLQTMLSAPNSPVLTDDPKFVLDWSPNSVNFVQEGSKVWRLQNDVTNPEAERVFSALNDQLSRVGIPDVFSGRTEQLSGQAISGFASVFQMSIGFRQQAFERSLSAMMEHALCLAKYYSPARGVWQVWGTSKHGKAITETLTADDIGDIIRVQAKLSASMPKDTAAMASLWSMLQQKGQISTETMIDLMQKLPEFGLGAESPSDEMQRILRDKILSNPKFMEMFAGQTAAQFLPFLMGAENTTPEEIAQANALFAPQPPMAPPGMGQMQGPGNAMTMRPGMPPGMAPGAMPGAPMPGGPMQMSGPPQVNMPGGGGVPSVPGPLQAPPEGA